VPIKPGTMLLKFPLNPRVYEVVYGNTAKHIPNPAVAIASYGAEWNAKIIELPEIYSLFYLFQ